MTVYMTLYVLSVHRGVGDDTSTVNGNVGLSQDLVGNGIGCRVFPVQLP